MTSLLHDNRPARPQPPRLLIADRIVLTILVLSIAAAIGLALATVLADLPADLSVDLPSLTPLDEAHYWSGFSA